VFLRCSSATALHRLSSALSVQRCGKSPHVLVQQCMGWRLASGGGGRWVQAVCMCFGWYELYTSSFLFVRSADRSSFSLSLHNPISTIVFYDIVWCVYIWRTHAASWLCIRSECSFVVALLLVLFPVLCVGCVCGVIRISNHPHFGISHIPRSLSNSCLLLTPGHLKRLQNRFQM